MKKIVFVGGVHGVGKTTVCQRVAEQTLYTHVIASHLIRQKKAESIRSDSKRVNDIGGNQTLLIESINELCNKEVRLLIDGHFTLVSARGKIEAISSFVFESIAPNSVAVIWDEPESISKKIEERDGVAEVVEHTRDHQVQEIEQAKRIAESLNIPFGLFKIDNFEEFLTFCNKN